MADDDHGQGFDFEAADAEFDTRTSRVAEAADKMCQFIEDDPLTDKGNDFDTNRVVIVAESVDGCIRWYRTTDRSAAEGMLRRALRSFR